MIREPVVTRTAMRSSLILGLAVSFSLAGCTSPSDSVDPARREAPSEQARPEEAKEPKRDPRRFDGQGRLLPSDDYAAGVRLPRGSELFYETELKHVYRIRAPIDKVLAYFGPMMITGKVERRGKGAIYRRASVRGAEISPTKVDLAILEVGNSLTRISVTEFPPPPEYIPNANQTKAAARDEFRTLD